MAEREYLVEQEYYNLDKTESIVIKIPKDTVKITQTKYYINLLYLAHKILIHILVFIILFILFFKMVNN